MATQTFEQLIAGANKIKENELPESNTHDLIGEQLLQMTNKMREISLVEASEAAEEAKRAAEEAKEMADIASQSGELAQYAKEQGDYAKSAGDKVTNEVLFKTAQSLTEEEQAQVKQNIGISIPISGLERLDWEEGRLGVVSNDSSDTGKMTSPSIPKSSYVICLLNVQGEDITLFVAPSEYSNNLPYYHFNSAIKQYGVTIQGNVLDDNSDFMNIQFTLNNLSDSAITLRCNNLYYQTISKNDLFKGQFSTPEELDVILGKKGAYAFVGNPRHLYDWDNGWVDRGEFVTDVDTVLNDTSEKAIANKAVFEKFAEQDVKFSKLDIKLGEINLLQGGLSSSTGEDTNVNYNERIKTFFIPQFKSIVLNDGFVLVNYCEYNKDGSFIKGEFIDNLSQFSLVTASENLYRFSIKKYDSSRIYPNENIVKEIKYYGAYLSGEVDLIKKEFSDAIYKLDKAVNILEGTSLNLSSSDISDGYYIDINGEVISTLSTGVTDYLNCSGFRKLNISVCMFTTTPIQTTSFYDENKEFISSVLRPQGSVIKSEIVEIDIPQNAAYFRATYFNESNRELYGEFQCTLSAISAGEPLDLMVAKIEEEQSNIQKDLITYKEIGELEYTTNSGYFDNDSQSVVSSSISVYTEINIEGYKYLSFYLTDYAANAGYIIYDADNEIIDSFNSKSIQFIELNVPTNAYKIIISWKTASVSQTIKGAKELVKLKDAITLLQEDLSNIGQLNSISIARQSIHFGHPVKYVSEATLSESTSDVTADNIYQLYDALCESYPNLIKRKEDIGNSALESMEIRHYTIGLTKYMLSSTSDRNIKGENSFVDDMSMPRIVITTGVHGTERAACYGVYLSIKDILDNFSKTDWANYILSNAIIELIPCSNPYGITNNIAGNGVIANLNRDFYTASQPETIAMQDFLKNTPFKIAMDFHNSGSEYDYLVTKENYKFYYFYVQVSTMYAQMMYNEYKERYSNDQSNFPWYYCWNSITSNNQFHDYVNNHLGKLAVSIETEGAQNKNTCQYTKNQVINYLQLFISAQVVE